jgi:hypothetical protein
MSLVANQASLAGKRVVVNEFHPGSGSPDALFPFAVYDSLVRLMHYRVASVAWFCDMHQGQFLNYSVANARPHIARARNQIILWNPYAGALERPRSKVACFMPSCFATPRQANEAAVQSEAAGRLPWALGELGADFYLLNDLDQARHYDRVVIFLAYADREAEQNLYAFLTKGATGKRVLLLTGVSRLWGPVGQRIFRRIDASLSEVLPVAPAGTRLVSKGAFILPAGDLLLGATYSSGLPPKYSLSRRA